MEKGNLEIFKSSYGYYNFRITDGKPSEELVTYLKGNGYRWSRNNNCWYPATSEAKEANLHDDFVAKFQENFFALQTGEQEQKSFAQDLIDRENRKEEWRKNHEETEKTARLESLIAELREELRRDKVKITQLENKLASREVEISPKELSIAKSVLPTAQYVTTLRYSQGEEGDFFKQKIKDIAKAVENAPKIGGTDGMEQHQIVARYFNPAGTETLVTEIGKDGEAYGFQCLNGDYEMAEWGYIDLNEIKGSPFMEMDYHVEEGMTVERWLYQEQPDMYPRYAKFAEKTVERNLSETPVVSKLVEIKPVTLEEILSVMEMKPETTSDGKIRIFDQQRGEYIDSREDFEKYGGLSFDFDNAAEIFERLDTYINDYFIHDMEEQLEAGGVTLRGDETLEDLCNYAKAQLEAGVMTVSQDELNLAMGIVKPSTVIMPEYALAQKSELENEGSDNSEKQPSKKDIKRLREQCREILKKPDDEITEADKAILAQYEGAGGLNEENRTNAGILNEFYTPSNLVEKVWQIVDAYAPNAKTVLEPSAGTGKFASNRPNNEFTMHELDETSARINRILHPDATVVQGAFQKQFFDDGERAKKADYELPKYDVVIGNPPYGTYSDKYKGLGEGKEFDRYEEYFIARGLDSLKDENSVMAFVVPSGFLNSANDKVKRLIAEKGELIDAYRLPTGTFPTTEVGTDIIIMRTWEKRRKEIEKWMTTVPEPFRKNPDDKFNETKQLMAGVLSNNDYFTFHTDKVLGAIKTRTNRFGKEEEYVAVHEGLTVQDELNKIEPMLPKADRQVAVEEKTEVSWKQLKEIVKEATTFRGDFDSIRNEIEGDNPEWTEKQVKEETVFRLLDETLDDFGLQTLYDRISFNEVNPEQFNATDVAAVRDGFLEDISERVVSGQIKNIEQAQYSFLEHFEQNEFCQELLKNNFLNEGRVFGDYEKKNLDWLVNTHGCSREETAEILHKLYQKFPHSEAFDRSKILPIAFGNLSYENNTLSSRAEKEANGQLPLDGADNHPLGVQWKVTAEDLEKVFGIFDEKLDHHTIGDREWAAHNGMAKEDVSRLLEWDYGINHQHKFITGESHSTNQDNEVSEPIKTKSARPKKEKWNIAKSKGEVMRAEEFAHLYGRDFDEREFPVWKATDWKGDIDSTHLTQADLDYLHTSENYIQRESGVWTHKLLFTTGDIYEKINRQKELLAQTERNKEVLGGVRYEYDKKLYESNITLLEASKKPLLEMKRIHFGLHSTLAEEFKIAQRDANGERVEMNMQEAFILWAQNVTLADTGEKYSRWSIDWATARLSREELPEEIEWSDIVDFIEGKPVKAERTTSWETRNMDAVEKAAFKAERKKEADVKRQLRSDTANRLFDRYLHEGLDDATRTRLVAEYNRRFNSYVAPDWSKLPLFVDGMSAYKGESKFKMYDQQIKGSSFLCYKGNGLLAHDVGVGKTVEGIVATVNQIQTERSKYPLIVVPNQVYAKWYTGMRQLFPNVPVNDLYNFNKKSFSKFVDTENPHKLNIPENSISLCTYEALKNITFTDKSCENELFSDFADLLSVDFDGSERENAGSAEKIKQTLGAASHVKDSSYYFFEDCGFDHLTVDEAHNFKNLWVLPRPKKKGDSNEYAGIPTGKPSARALKMYAMTQLVQRKNDDRNVFMLTATPFTNSPLEVYSMLSYIGRERLKQSGIRTLRNFLDQFAQTKQELGVTSAGNIDTKQVMKNWKELPALQAILTEFIDKVDGEEAGIILPNKFTHVKPLDMSALQKEMRDIDEKRMADVKKGDSAAVIVAMNNMRLACVAPALANPAMYPGIELPPKSQLVETSPKLKFVCDAIVDMYKGNPEKGQFMYVPLGKESHGMIKDYLVRHGIPKEAVEIINGEVNNTPEKKEKVTSHFNDEKNPLKIIIGGKNTAEGIDLNGNTFVMYNCSLGWNPSETIQAEGRPRRQGNLQGNVHIVYPVMNDSIDSVLYQKHDEKRSRINELWNYKGDLLNVEDINPEDLKIELIKDPAKRAKLILQEETKEARAELSRLDMKIKTYDDVVEKRKSINNYIEMYERSIAQYQGWIDEAESEGNEGPDWWKDELSLDKKRLAASQRQLDTVNGKLFANGVHNADEESAYIRKLNTQKHETESKIKDTEKRLPEIIEKLRVEQMEQKATEYPVEKQREILEADILNNLRPMKEVAYEIKTMRFEAMLAEKLKSGDISQKEHDEYKAAGYEKYEQWQNGEIDSLEENIAPVPKADSLRKPSRHENRVSINEDIGGLFFGMSEDEMFVHSNEKGYARSSEQPYFNAGNDDFMLTPEQLTASEQKRDEIVLPILNGKETGMYKAFNDFARHGVFDVQGAKIELADGGITAEGWRQLHAAMSIYRSKEFETMRYVLVDRASGEIRDQLAVSSRMPNACRTLDSTDTLKSLINRAEEKDCLIVAVHNHPSGNVLESEEDARATESLERSLTRTDGFSRFGGHIILDHDTFNLYTSGKGWAVKMDWDSVGKEDALINKDFAFKNDMTDTTEELMRVAAKLNDTASWSDDFVPVVFSTPENNVTGVKFYDKSFFDKTPEQIRNELQFAGIEAGATKAFPVFTQALSDKMTPIESLLFEEKLKNLVSGHAFTDAALPKSTVVEKYDMKPGFPFFDEKSYQAKLLSVEKTWETRINPTLLQQMQTGTLRIAQIGSEPLRAQKPRLKTAVGMGY